jgi:hypothetical protein
MQTQAERMALIRETARNFKTKRAMQARFEREENAKVDGSELHWSDARKYAGEYYGEVYRETTRFDNDWD